MSILLVQASPSRLAVFLRGNPLDLVNGGDWIPPFWRDAPLSLSLPQRFRIMHVVLRIRLVISYYYGVPDKAWLAGWLAGWLAAVIPMRCCYCVPNKKTCLPLAALDLICQAM